MKTLFSFEDPTLSTEESRLRVEETGFGRVVILRISKGLPSGEELLFCGLQPACIDVRGTEREPRREAVNPRGQPIDDRGEGASRYRGLLRMP
ncbi:MAG: hypothetical protein AABM40_09615 [Chloroflexota bacterium]